MKLRATLLLLAAVAACKGGASARGGAGVGEACAADADCASPLTCVSGKCALPGSLQACAPNARRCQGSDVMECDAAGLQETLAESCPQSCRDGACVSSACAPGDRRCGPAGVEQCEPGPSGPAWAQVEACPAGCANAACNTLACKPLDARCNPDLQVCAADGSGWVSQPCAAGSACASGQCVARKCSPGATSCNGNVLVVCDATGGGYAQQTPCAGLCSNGACMPAVCTPGATRCSSDGSSVEACRPDGSGWSLQQACGALGCAALATDRAACKAMVCAPLTRRCTAAADGVQVCAGDGSGWSLAEACVNGCADGACLPPPSGCTAGALRCSGDLLQQCSGGAWSTLAECLGGCSTNACVGRSCAPGFALNLPASGPADGVSTLLATTGVITDASGAPLPDGTALNVSITGAANRQVVTLGGTADFEVPAPVAAGSVQVSVTVAGSTVCSAAGSIAFGAPASLAFASEDFTTSAERDFVATTADWQTAWGRAAEARNEMGDGRDGAFTAPAGSWDLTTRIRPGGAAPYAPVLVVTAVGPQAVSVTGAFASAFQPGDEALLIELQGASPGAVTAAGAWELLTVAQSANGQVTFTTPVLGVYGQSPGAPLAGEKVVLQRVPHFSSLTVPANAALTAGAWDGTQGGVVALRVAGAAAVTGAIHADLLGFRGGDSGDSVHGQPGESYGGFGAVSTSAAALFGGGGGGYGCGDPWHLSQLDTWYGSGGSYGSAGASTCGGFGAPYGSPSLARLFFGSASGSQELNTHQACSDSSCPADGSLVVRPPASLQNGSSCGTDPNCNAGTFSYCRGSSGFGFAALPCDSTNNPGCSNTFNSCSMYTQAWADSPYPGTQCSTFCPRLVGARADCFHCGCNRSNPHLCAMPSCNSAGGGCDIACFGGNCGSAGNTTGFFNGCPAVNNTCPSSCNGCNTDSYQGTTYCDQWCDGNCNAIGTSCDCFYECMQCWDGAVGPGPGSSACFGPDGSACNTCNVCTGCQTNPGCETNPGCHTCGPYPDGTICDYTTPGANCQCPNPWQGHAAGGRGGGMVLLFAATLDLSGGGRVSASGGAPAAGNFGGSGGSLFVRVGALKLASSGVQLSATGAAGGGAGRVRFERASGDDPVARGQISPSPYTTAFALPQAQSVALPLPAGRKAVGATLAAALDAGTPAGAPAPAEAYFLSADGGNTWLPLAPGTPVSFAATADVRWRVRLTPQLGVPAAVQALSLTLQLQ